MITEVKKRISIKEGIKIIEQVIKQNHIICSRDITKLTGIGRTRISALTSFYMPDIKSHNLRFRYANGKHTRNGIKFYYFNELDNHKLNILSLYKKDYESEQV